MFVLFALVSSLVGVAQPDVRFVASTTAVVRAEAKDNARTVVDVGIGAPVSVLQIVKGADGAPWARVVVGPRVFRLDAPDGEPVPIAPGTFDPRLPQGFIHVVDLGTTAPSRRALLADAVSLPEEKRGATLLRAWALDPHDVDVARVAAPTAKALTARRERSPVERADLVFGCSGDIARASVIAGSVSSLAGARTGTRDDVCVAGLDVRVPCDAASNPAVAQTHKADMARLVPRYGNDGPALRLVLGPGAGERPVWIVARFLDVDGCVDCAPTASTREVKVTRLRVPRVEKGTTLLHVLVPRAVGVLYSVVSAANREDVDDDALSFELGDAFDADPRDEPGPGAHLFAAPDVCSCTCDGGDGADDVDDAP